MMKLNSVIIFVASLASGGVHASGNLRSRQNLGHDALMAN